MLSSVFWLGVGVGLVHLGWRRVEMLAGLLGAGGSSTGLRALNFSLCTSQSQGQFLGGETPMGETRDRGSSGSPCPRATQSGSYLPPPGQLCVSLGSPLSS